MQEEVDAMVERRAREFRLDDRLRRYETRENGSGLGTPIGLMGVSRGQIRRASRAS